LDDAVRELPISIPSDLTRTFIR